MIAELC